MCVASGRLAKFSYYESGVYRLFTEYLQNTQMMGARMQLLQTMDPAIMAFRGPPFVQLSLYSSVRKVLEFALL